MAKINNLPNWLQNKENYQAKANKFSALNFLVRNIKKFNLLSDKFKQKGKGKNLGVLSFVLFVFEILFLSISEKIVFIWILLIIILFKIAVKNRKDIIKIFKRSFYSSLICFLILLPMICLNSNAFNSFFLIKTFIILLDVNLFVVGLSLNDMISLSIKLHLSNSFTFILGIMSKYLNVLNKQLIDQMSAVQLKSVGKIKHSYNILGNVFGSIYLNSVNTSQDVHDAMIARGYTGEFKTAKFKYHLHAEILSFIELVLLLLLFILVGK